MLILFFYRVKLEVPTFHPAGEKVQIFPTKDKNTISVAQQGEAKLREYESSAEFKQKILNTKKNAELNLTV